MALFIAEDTDSTFVVRPGENTLQAAASALKAEAWAEGTLPGGAGTKSAKEWAAAADGHADRSEAARDVSIASSAQYPSAAAAVAGLADGAFGSYLDVDGNPVWGQRVGASMVALPGPWLSAEKVSATGGGTVQSALTTISTYYRSQTAGGVVTPGRNIIVGDTGNAVASDLGGCSILGGGRPLYENIIGGSPDNIGVSVSNPIVTGTQADYSVIFGGYDNVASGLMSVVGGAHCYTTSSTTHGTISGGSFNNIKNGDYNTISGGTLSSIDTTGGFFCTIGGGFTNSITGTVSRCTIAGGGNNTITGASQGTIGGGYANSIASTATQGVIAGGTGNNLSGLQGTIGGGNTNSASGKWAVIAGGNTQIASGDGSTIGGGNQNQVTASAATVGGGEFNQATFANATVSGGSTNLASGSGSSVTGGKQNTASGQYSVIAGGFTNTASNSYSCVVGGASSTASGNGSTVLNGQNCVASAAYSMARGAFAVSNIIGQSSFSAGRFTTAGDCQYSDIHIRRQITTATPTGLRPDGGATFLVMPDNTTWTFLAYVAARRVDGGGDESAGYKVEGVIKRGTGAATVAFVGTPTITVLGENTAAWDISVAADTVNGSLNINFTGESGKTINASGRLQIVEITG